MKKFISFVMAGAMVASLVPATAFAKGDVTATAKIVDALEKDKDFNGVISQTAAPELQFKVTSVDYTVTDPELAKMDVELTLDKAEFKKRVVSGSSYTDQLLSNDELIDLVRVKDDETGNDVLGKWDDELGKVEADVTFTETAGVSANQIATAIQNGTIAADVALWKSKTDYLVAKTDNAFKADFAIGDEDPAGPSYATRRDAAWAAYPGVTQAAYILGEWNGNAAYVRTVADPVEPAYVLVATLHIADPDKYDANDVIANIQTKVQAKITAGYKVGTVVITNAQPGAPGVSGGKRLGIMVKESDKDSVTFTFKGFFKKDDKVIFDMASIMTKTSEGTKATVSVDSKMVTADDLVFASILGKGFKASVKKTVDVAEDETVKLNSNGLKIEAAVGNLPSKVTLKVSSGFEFTKANDTLSGTNYTVDRVDEKELTVNVTGAVDEISVKDIEIEATSAKSGAVATITAKANNTDSASCEVAKVVDYKVSLTVDADEDVPVIYSGTNVDNKGITDDSDHMSLEVTAKETFPGAWSMRQGFNFNLPEGVYVTDVKVTDADNFYKGTTTTEASTADWKAAFETAYQDGDHKNFEFKKRVFNDVDTVLGPDPAELTFQLELVADPTFEGDVKLSFEGALVDKQEVTIAKFAKPYTVKADQNDVIIDYRNTEVKTPIVITEAEEGLWEKDSTFTLSIEDDLLTFEDDPTFTVDSASDMELKDDKATKGTIKFSVKEESDKVASVTISDMKLFMSRSIPAGAYDLEIGTTMKDGYDRQKLFAPDATTVAAWTSGDRPSESTTKKDSYVDDVCDYSDVVKEAFINVVTSGRDNDNLFTTKVVVPVGESYLLAGENKVTLDTPAYVSAAGYTMLPVRAVSKALGVDTNNVLWSAETKTVTIMYAQRIITMTVGQKTIYVNGSAIPASSAPEIKDGRTFLPLRDLGTALGVTNVDWDSATKTATLNGGTTATTTAATK